MSNLCESLPHVVKFYHAVEGRLTNRFYPEKSVGRAADGFIYITDGMMRYRFSDGKTVEVKKGDVLFLSKGSIYSMELLAESYQFIFVDFEFSESGFASEVYEVQNVKGIHSLFSRMLEKWRQKKTAAMLDCLSILYSIYSEMVRTKNSVYVPHSKRKQLDNAVQYISEHFTEETLTVESVAQAASMSESNFRRVFKSVYHVSPVRYIMLVRLDRAKELICYTTDSLSTIALDTGFANLYYFSRIFKKEVGCTPSEYRAEYGDRVV